MILPLAILMAAAVPSAPQAPFAAGPFLSVGEIVRAAHACGVDSIRLETYRSPGSGEARLFYSGPVSAKAERCLMAWETRNGRRLHLKPRWWKDDFTRDWP